VNFFRQYRFVLLFLALLVFCSIMVIRQLKGKESKHVEIREAFILLHTRGYTNYANNLYLVLLRELPQLPSKNLLDDFQRTLILVDPSGNHPDNLIWKYHWTVSNEMERRSEGSLRRAIKLAEEAKKG
jgi:hypothetical protein